MSRVHAFNGTIRVSEIGRNTLKPLVFRGVNIFDQDEYRQQYQGVQASRDAVSLRPKKVGADVSTRDLTRTRPIPTWYEGPLFRRRQR